tara:strand:- start:48 stop:638 length:591 start_codon:yes stop_codon:yes gene_type:complete
MYNDKLPDMSAAYAEIQEKMAKKDHDGDGKIETGKEEYFGARDKAIKKAMKKEHHEKDADGKVIEHDVEEVEEAMVVTNADKKGNTPAYQNFKKGMKSKTTGKPMYKAADHMKEEEIHPDDNVLSPEELERVAELSREWDAKMEEGYGGKPMMSKGGEVKPPRTAKGAMAYDGPNKAASEAKDRLVAKAKAMREKK